MVSKRHFWLVLSLIFSLCLLLPESGTAQTTPDIVLLEPGEGSEVVSPITIKAQIPSGGDRLLRITLIDEQNNLLSRKLLRLPSSEDSLFQFQTDLYFEIPRESTLALLTLVTQDDYHRPQSLRSTVLMLESTGEAILVPAEYENNWLTITQPAPMEIISGGAFQVTGEIKPLNDNPVVFELMTERGSIIGTSQLDPQNLGETIEFEINLSYDFIYEERDVRLVVRQRTREFASDAILDSMPIFLRP
ncbi:MAG: hypothetical protein SVT56_02220 [Chloroflexota bacterium]|jgi:hypothetical protein|nr:hypothetical protein [Chloroflexota bacterium]